MSKKLFDFISSFGMMLVGVFLLFASTVSFSPAGRQWLKLPASNPRQLIGGDAIAENLPVSHPSVPLQNNKDNFIGTLTAQSVLVIDDKTDTILFEKNSDAVRPLASVTKLMSALVLLDLPIQWSTTTEIFETDDVGSSHIINAGEKFTADDLWHVGLIGSSNSAINALVRISGLTPTQFAARMNRKARDLQLTSAHFVEATGLNAGNVANVHDTAKLLKNALQQDKIFKAVQVGEYYAHPLGKNKPRRVWSTDWLLTKWVPSNFAAAQIAGKTGFINESNYNFAVRLSDNNSHAVRVVILGASTNENRFSEARDLATWVFANYLWPDQAGYEKLAE